MPEETNIDDKLKAVFANPQTRAAVASAIASPRPAGWSKHSKASYFRKCYADEIKGHIDEQIKTGQDLVFRYETWCRILSISERTLYTRINQSILYLVEKMDVDGVYSKWYENVDIDCKTSGLGIVISISKIAETKALKPELVVPRQSLPQWRKDLMDWLESDTEDPFVRENIALSTEEITLLREEFLTNEGLMCNIKANSIHIVKV